MTIERQLMLRRSFIKGLVSSAGLVTAGCNNFEPPTYGNVLRMGDLLTYKAHRLLLPSGAMAREFEHGDITPVMAVGTANPADTDESLYDAEFGPVYERLLADGLSSWQLTIEGSVTRPGTYSLSDLMRMPSRTQITRHVCEEGWSAIAEWTGVPLHHVLRGVGTRPEARYVQFYSYDNYADGIDMFDALHPQTILAYGMNGRTLPISHGAPLRVRVETQLGYKSMKFLRRIVVTEAFDDHGSRGNIRNGWSWYAGI